MSAGHAGRHAGICACLGTCGHLCTKDFMTGMHVWGDLCMFGMVQASSAAAVHCASIMQAWRQGQTGYPLVDAAMRQLSSTGKKDPWHSVLIVQHTIHAPLASTHHSC